MAASGKLMQVKLCPDEILPTEAIAILQKPEESIRKLEKTEGLSSYMCVVLGFYRVYLESLCPGQPIQARCLWSAVISGYTA